MSQHLPAEEPQGKPPEGPQWLSTMALRSKPNRVDHEEGVIYGASVVTEGEAKGHGMHLEAEFVDEVVRMGNDRKGGLKARFGHPSMCSTALGTYLGKFKNFRRAEKGGKAQAIADLYLSNEAKETPNGNLYKYVLGMADNESDQFGTSIVFDRGPAYQRDNKGAKRYCGWQKGEDGEWHYVKPLNDRKIFTEIRKLHACDAVDDPAANEGLFSAFSAGALAGQLTEFLDTHPEVFEVANQHPELVEKFLSRYEQYKNKQSEAIAMAQGKQGAEEAPETNESPVELSSTAKPAAEPAEETELSSQTEPGKGAAEPAKDPDDNADDRKSLSREEFARVHKEFGAEVASEVMLKGGDYNTALKLSHDRLKAENEELKAQVKQLRAGIDASEPGEGAEAVPFGDGSQTKAKPKRMRDAAAKSA
jgi:hypothetical protein